MLFSTKECKQKRQSETNLTYFLTQNGYYTVRANQKQKKAGPIPWKDRHIESFGHYLVCPPLRFWGVGRFCRIRVKVEGKLKIYHGWRRDSFNRDS